jgi:hypothetical protein
MNTDQHRSKTTKLEYVLSVLICVHRRPRVFFSRLREVQGYENRIRSLGLRDWLLVGSKTRYPVDKASK